MVLCLLLEPTPLIPFLRRRELDVEAHDQSRNRRPYAHQSEGSADAAVGTCVRELGQKNGNEWGRDKWEVKEGGKGREVWRTG